MNVLKVLTKALITGAILAAPCAWAYTINSGSTDVGSLGLLGVGILGLAAARRILNKPSSA